MKICVGRMPTLQKNHFVRGYIEAKVSIANKSVELSGPFEFLEFLLRLFSDECKFNSKCEVRMRENKNRLCLSGLFLSKIRNYLYSGALISLYER